MKKIQFQLLLADLPLKTLLERDGYRIAPVAVGVKLTEMMQLAPAFTAVPQLFTSLKSPDAVMLAIASVSAPMFVRYTDCGGAVVETVCALVNVSVAGNIAMPWSRVAARATLTPR